MRLSQLLLPGFYLAGLLAVSTPVCASELPSNVSEEKAAELLFLSTRDLLETSYKCQGVIGPDTYVTVKGMTGALFSAMGADQKTTDNFITSQEAVFSSECEDKATCWRRFMNMPTEDKSEGQIACLKKNNQTTALIKSLLKIITRQT